ncbi:hypothetical protein DVH07_18360 [Hafnia paralvei]|uniref:type VI secretion protein IcmF/TssM N-terminal domain-containing protein n=1 Tax=Hafnia paralvei TaxID=546367 RepID=UPI000DF494CD|nr:type VI secretion protein IcmF/TssM N-terminal domain-containing protein [Hafnia paralvei]RDA61913.1 hypothetical protein DU449_17920 [Hafnia paralvei]RDA62974.1 hypothetical protein DVH08_20130 [Hafnia paralvei]RDA63814.1 hypothetical protein DVH09_18490 [Hafnia paralvei]RDA75100.1 hypothetical protein DVH10_17660 [Hafnia paralvei]RDA75504.1 hypothetical protein DVH07_18360 [Hafnia paralvei]
MKNKLLHYLVLSILAFISFIFCFIYGISRDWDTAIILFFWLAILLVPILILKFINPFSFSSVIWGAHRTRGKYRSRQEFLLFNLWNRGAKVIRQKYKKKSNFAWYIMIGDKCGKSTLLSKSGIPNYHAEINNEAITKNSFLKWWFFSKIAILDVSSNFLSGRKNLKKQWANLSKWCKQIPSPSGIIITISIRELHENNINRLSEIALAQKKMLEPLMTNFKGTLPIYIIVTQSDLFPGFDLWQKQLSKSQTKQALGYTWELPLLIDGQNENALLPLFDSIKRGMSVVRLSMARPDNINSDDYDLLLDVPEKFIELCNPLHNWLTLLCEKNAWYNAHSIHGIWFTAMGSSLNDSDETSNFCQHLFKCHLFSLAQVKEQVKNHCNTKLKLVYCSFVIIIAIWISISATVLKLNLKPFSDKTSPHELAMRLRNEDRFLNDYHVFFPFLSILNKKYTNTEKRLDELTIGFTPLDKTLLDYKKHTLSATPLKQREYILELANTIRLWQKMRDGATIDELLEEHYNHFVFTVREYPPEQTSLVKLVTERHYMKLRVGKIWIQAAQRLLQELVNHDPSLAWLLAPSDELPPLSAEKFWPSLSTVQISGIWTKPGQKAVSKWIDRIEMAAGERFIILQNIQDAWPFERQKAWLHFLSDIENNLSQKIPNRLSTDELIDISQGNSPSMRFLSTVTTELSDIPESQSQPWLKTLQVINRNILIDKKINFSEKISSSNDQIRNYFKSMLNNTHTTSNYNSDIVVGEAWKKWFNIRNTAVKEALSQKMPTLNLTKGLFSYASDTVTNNTLSYIYPSLRVLKSKIILNDNLSGVNIVWSIFESDVNRLISNAISQSACAINDIWKRDIIWPMNNKNFIHSYDYQQNFSRMLVAKFLYGPVASLLVTEKNGFSSAQYAGIKVPLTPEFLILAGRFLSQDEMLDIPLRTSTYEKDQRSSYLSEMEDLKKQKDEIEIKNIEVSVTSLPATVPNDSRIRPIGTKLTLTCDSSEQKITNMNFSEKIDFLWKPGHCDLVNINIIFPNFSTNYKLSGDNAWPLFLNKISSGEILIDPDFLSDNVDRVKQLGIKKILVRFTSSDTNLIHEIWQNWKSLSDRIEFLNEEIENINHSLSEQSTGELTSIPLSELPTDIAQCK